jgi:hypothetical protein
MCKEVEEVIYVNIINGVTECKKCGGSQICEHNRYGVHYVKNVEVVIYVNMIEFVQLCKYV